LPRLPLDRLVRCGDARTQGPFAVIAEIKSAWRLTHLSDAAISAGLTAGLSVPDARSICPHLLTEPHDPVREAGLLRALWRWADRLSPWVSPDPPDELLLDITGCAHLFGGEEGMGKSARQRLQDLQIESRIGIADTKGAARALARFGQSRVEIAPPGGTVEALHELPLDALTLPLDTTAELRRTGIRTIGQLHAVKSSELARRFGLDLTTTLSRAMGHTPDPVTPRSADPVYAARMTLPDPIGLLDDLTGVLGRLAASVCSRLAEAQKGARRYHLTVRCVDTGDHVITAGFAKPTHDPAALLQQFARPLDELTIEFGADWFRLAADHVEPVQPRQTGFASKEDKDDGAARIVATLGNRLGFDRVRQWAPSDSHLPELEFTSVEAIDRPTPPVWQPAPRNRPIRLYRRPEPLSAIEPGRPPRKFEWRHQIFTTEKASGPERLMGEWWREDSAPQRDYWQVQTTSGLRLWLLTYPGLKTSGWFVAGRFP